MHFKPNQNSPVPNTSESLRLTAKINFMEPLLSTAKVRIKAPHA